MESQSGRCLVGAKVVSSTAVVAVSSSKAGVSQYRTQTLLVPMMMSTVARSSCAAAAWHGSLLCQCWVLCAVMSSAKGQVAANALVSFDEVVRAPPTPTTYLQAEKGTRAGWRDNEIRSVAISGAVYVRLQQQRVSRVS